MAGGAGWYCRSRMGGVDKGLSGWGSWVVLQESYGGEWGGNSGLLSH